MSIPLRWDIEALRTVAEVTGGWDPDDAEDLAWLSNDFVNAAGEEFPHDRFLITEVVTGRVYERNFYPMDDQWWMEAMASGEIACDGEGQPIILADLRSGNVYSVRTTHHIDKKEG